MKDPLLQLVKSTEYLAGMKAAQEFKKGYEDALMPVAKPKVKKPEHGFRIKAGEIMVKKLFKSEDEAVKWATWNYKGIEGWKVVAPVLISPIKPKRKKV